MRYEVTGWSGAGQLATAIAAPSSNAEHFYGYGEKFDSLDQAGKRVHTLTFDEPGVKGDRSYKVAPWFMSTRGYGVHFDSPAECIFDMRASAPDRYVITNPLGTLALNIVYGPLLPMSYAALPGIQDVHHSHHMGIRSLDILGYLAEWRRSTLCSYSISQAQNPGFRVRVRFSMGNCI